MSTSSQHERYARARQAVAYRPDMFTAFQVDIDDGDVEFARFDPGEGVGNRFTSPGDLMAERFEKILQHHRDQGFVLDDQDVTRRGHGVRLRRREQFRNYYFACRASRVTSANFCTEKGLARNPT